MKLEITSRRASQISKNNVIDEPAQFMNKRRYSRVVKVGIGFPIERSEAGQQCNFDEISAGTEEGPKSQRKKEDKPKNKIEPIIKITEQSQYQGVSAPMLAYQNYENPPRSYTTANNYHAQAKLLNIQKMNESQVKYHPQEERNSKTPQVRMTQSMYRLRQDKQLEQAGIALNTRPHSKQSGSSLLIRRKSQLYQKAYSNARNQQLSVNSQSTYLNKLNQSSVKGRQQEDGYMMMQFQTSIDGHQAIVPMILSTEDILGSTTEDLNQSGSTDDQKKTILSRQATRQGVREDPNPQFEAYSNDPTLHMNSMLSNGLSKRGKAQKVDSSDEYSFESSKRFQNQHFQQHNQGYFKENSDGSFYLSRRKLGDQSVLNPFSPQRWSSRLEDDLTHQFSDIQITDQHIRRQNEIQLKKQSINDETGGGNISAITRKSQLSQSRNYISKLSKENKNSSNTFQGSNIVKSISTFGFDKIPEFKIQRQSRQEGFSDQRRQSMNQSIFMTSTKKGLGLQRECASSFAHILNNKTCLGQSVFKFSMDLPLRLKKQMWQQHQRDKMKAVQQDYDDNSLEVMGTSQVDIHTFNTTTQSQFHIMPQEWTHELSSPKLPKKEHESPYKSLIQPTVYESRIMSNEDSHSHHSTIRSQRIMLEDQASPKKASKHGKIIYSINKSTQNRNSMLRSKGDVAFLRRSIDSRQSSKKVEKRHSIVLEGLINVRSINNNKSTLSSINQIKQHPSGIALENYPLESGGNSSMNASQEQLEPRPYANIGHRSHSSQAIQRVELKHEEHGDLLIAKGNHQPRKLSKAKNIALTLKPINTDLNNIGFTMQDISQHKSQMDLDFNDDNIEDFNITQISIKVDSKSNLKNNPQNRG